MSEDGHKQDWVLREKGPSERPPPPESKPEAQPEPPPPDAPPARQPLRFKEPVAASVPINPAVERLTKSAAKPRRENAGRRWKAVVLVLVLIFAAAGAAFLLVDFREPADAPTWRAASTVLTVLKEKPADRRAMVELKAVFKTLQPDDSLGPDHDARTALMTVYALGQLMNGELEAGFAACDFIRQKHAGTAFAELVARDALSIPCPACGGKGRVARDVGSGGLSRPGGDIQRLPGSSELTGPCRVCKGTGRRASEDKVKRQYGAALDKAVQIVSVKRLGGSLRRGLSRWQQRLRGRNGDDPAGDAAAD